jgi:hypothetical protein
MNKRQKKKSYKKLCERGFYVVDAATWPKWKENFVMPTKEYYGKETIGR